MGDTRAAAVAEVVAMLGDSLVGVTYCSPPERRPRARTTLLLVAGISGLLVSAIVIARALDTAADNRAAYVHATTVSKLPPRAVRPRVVPASHDALALGGLLVAFVALVASRARRREPRPSVHVGTAPGVDFATADAPVRDFPLVTPHGDGFALHLDREMVGTLDADGCATSIGERAARHGTIVPIAPGATLRLRLGALTFVVRSVQAPSRTLPASAIVDRRVLAWVAGSLALHLGVWGVLRQVPVDAGEPNIAWAARERSFVTARIAVADGLPPVRTAAADDAPVARRTARAGEAGALGTGRETRAPRAREMARGIAMRRPAHPGEILGTPSIEALASLQPNVDFAAAFDDADIYLGLLGHDAGERPDGGFGTSHAGFGLGGGGTDTIPTGAYRTDPSTGGGFGLGGGRCGCGHLRTAAVPAVSVGVPVARGGELDPAIIRRYVRRNLERIRYCYETQLIAKPELAGTVSTRFFITATGIVAAASATGVDEETASCVADVIRRIEFPAPRGGGGVEVSYPFTFQRAGS